MHLVKVKKRYKKTFLTMLVELSSEGEEKKSDIENTSQFFTQYLKDITDRKSNPQKGRVAESTYWMIHQKECIGIITIRHAINKNLLKMGGHIGYVIKPSKRNMGYGSKMLELALRKCKKMNLKKVLITCSLDNQASAGVIKNNGGVLEDIIDVRIENKARKTARYWIEIKQEAIMNQAKKPTGLIGRMTAKSMALGHKDFYLHAAKALQLKEEDRYLEIGFGSGYFIHQYASKVKHIQGIDYSQDMVALCQKVNEDLVKNGTATFIQGDAMNLPFEKESFTAVCSIESLYFWKDPLRGLKNIYSVLSYGGRVVIELAFNKEDGKAHEREVKKQEIVLFSEEEIRTLLEKAGFLDITFNYYQSIRMPFKGYVVSKGMVACAYKRNE